MILRNIRNTSQRRIDRHQRMNILIQKRKTNRTMKKRNGCLSTAIFPGLRLTNAIVILTISSYLPAANTAAKQPNVVLILADDLAVGDLGGQHDGRCRTPHLDQLASESVRFNRAYSGSCVCAPARAALLTGRYPHRTGVVTLNMNKFPKLTRLRSDEATIADYMKAAGYTTGLIGKWHLGRGENYHPLRRGFDVFEGFDGSDDVGYFQYRFDVQGKVTRITDRYLTNDLTDRAIEFVRGHRSQPFFLHLAHYAPHRPLEAPEGLIQEYRDKGFEEKTATIYAMIEIMDRGIGRLLDELDTLKIADDTIVIFAADNGPDPLTGERFNHALRGTKYQVYEGGIRVPLFVRWKGRLSAGDRNPLVHFVDLLPTVLGLCNIDAKGENALDGLSFENILRDESAEFSAVRYWQWNRGQPNGTHNAAIRDGKLKLVRPFVTRGLNLQDSTLPPLLFDLDNDPSESRDIANQNPDVVSRMNEQLQQWTESIESDRIRPVTNHSLKTEAQP